MSEQNLTALKTLVISMGVLLVVGFLVVGAAAWMKIKANTAPKTIEAQNGTLPAECPGGTIDMKGKGPVLDTSVEGSTLRMAFANPDGNLEMVHVDMCTGKQTSALKIEVDLPRGDMAGVGQAPQAPMAPPSLSMTPIPTEPSPAE